MNIKHRVQAWLEKEGKSQEWLAKRVGVSAPHLSMILSGDRTPSLGVAARIEKVTGIPARDFAAAGAA